MMAEAETGEGDAKDQEIKMSQDVRAERTLRRLNYVAHFARQALQDEADRALVVDPDFRWEPLNKRWTWYLTPPLPASSAEAEETTNNNQSVAYEEMKRVTQALIDKMVSFEQGDDNRKAIERNAAWIGGAKTPGIIVTGGYSHQAPFSTLESDGLESNYLQRVIVRRAHFLNKHAGGRYVQDPNPAKYFMQVWVPPATPLDIKWVPDAERHLVKSDSLYDQKTAQAHVELLRGVLSDAYDKSAINVQPSQSEPGMNRVVFDAYYMAQRWRYIPPDEAQAATAAKTAD